MNHSFDIDIARTHGVDAAIIIENFRFWIAKNKANGRHFYDGRWWTYNSSKAMAELFPYWSAKQIERIISKLKESGVLLVGHYSQNAYDRTNWYSLEGIDSPKPAVPFPEIGKSTRTDISTSVNTDIGDATAPLTKTVTVKMLVSEGVEKQIAEDWLTLRKAKRLPLTHTAWADTKAEGEKVGLTPAQTVAHAVSSNWAGFKASWYAKESGNTERPMSFAQQEEQARRKRWEEMTGRKWPDENPVLEIFDVKELE